MLRVLAVILVAAARASVSADTDGAYDAPTAAAAADSEAKSPLEGKGDTSKEGGHEYSAHESVPLKVNKIGPFSNPSETYPYYHLPFCKPKDPVEHDHKLGEIVKGDRFHSSLYDIRFKTDIQWQALCRKAFNAEDIKHFKLAIDQDYYFEFLFDDLPIWGYIGDKEALADSNDKRYYLYTHLDFSIAYNRDKVIEVNVSVDPLQHEDISEAKDTIVEFSYSAKWSQTSMPYSKRMLRYSQYSFLPENVEIHWLSIINSFVLVLLLTVFLSIILVRVLKNDCSRYMKAEEDDLEDDSGWKLVHADVFRFPANKTLFCAALGAGAQLLVMCVAILLMALGDAFHVGARGAMYTAVIVWYALTAIVSGYVSARYYKMLDGDKWVWNIVLAAGLFSWPFFGMFMVLNSVAWHYGSTAALPFGTIIIILLIMLLAGFPLTVVGGIGGRHMAPEWAPPVRTNKLPRELPEIPFYRQGAAQVIMAGFLPFSAIYIELHYIFSSVWGQKTYALYGILSLAFVMLLIVTSFMTIALTYFQLAIEDHYWWWRAFFSGGSTGMFIYLYCVFYYFHRSEMFGLLQTSFFFGYMAMVSYGFFLMLGTVGFVSALAVVHKIYGTIKCD